MSRPDHFPDCMALYSKREACLGYRETFTKLDLAEKEIERLRAALEPFARYYDLNDCQERDPREALEVPISDLAAAQRAYQQLSNPTETKP